MKIAQLAPLWLSVPPKKYGGTERVIHDVNQGLAKLGHEIVLFAAEGSYCDGETVNVTAPLFESKKAFDFMMIDPHEILEFSMILDRIDEFDIIHNHNGMHPLLMSQLTDVPVVTTSHSSVEPDFPYLAKRYKNEPFVSISNAQRRLTPYLNWVKTIYNPIDFSLFDPNFDEAEDYLLFIGALNKPKGVHLAIQAAIELGQRLILAGNATQEGEYYGKYVEPYLKNPLIEYVGEVDDKQKAKLYRNAKGFLFPSQWHEAFGLVMVEALASGTPVVAFDKGAVPEIIEHGNNGFIASNYEEFKECIGSLDELDRKTCYESVEGKYDVVSVAKEYEELFEELIKNDSK